MRLVDSNIVIYATQPGNDWLRALLFTQPFGVSVITLVEVLYSTLILPSSSRGQHFDSAADSKHHHWSPVNHRWLARHTGYPPNVCWTAPANDEGRVTG